MPQVTFNVSRELSKDVMDIYGVDLISSFINYVKGWMPDFPTHMREGCSVKLLVQDVKVDTSDFGQTYNVVLVLGKDVRCVEEIENG